MNVLKSDLKWNKILLNFDNPIESLDWDDAPGIPY